MQMRNEEHGQILRWRRNKNNIPIFGTEWWVRGPTNNKENLAEHTKRMPLNYVKFQ